MPTLYGWGPAFGCPSPSPFVMKTEIHLQMLNIQVDRAFADLQSVSKQKAPYLQDGDVLVEDSNFIRAHFEKKLNRNLDDGLSPSQRSASWALERLVEGHLRDAIVMERWQVPENFNKGPRIFFAGAPQTVIDDVLKKQAEMFWGAGIGRHSRQERLQLADWDLNAVALQLGDQPFLFGEAPTVADAAVGAMLISAATRFFDTPLSEMVHAHDNLASYIGRMEARYFADNQWPSPAN